MSKVEILEELPKLNAIELREIHDRILQLEEEELVSGRAGPSEEEKALLDREMEDYSRDNNPGSNWEEVQARLNKGNSAIKSQKLGPSFSSPARESLRSCLLFKIFKQKIAKRTKVLRSLTSELGFIFAVFASFCKTSEQKIAIPPPCGSPTSREHSGCTSGSVRLVTSHF